MSGRPPHFSGSRTGLRDLLALGAGHGGLFTTGEAGRVGVSDRMLTYYVQRGDVERIAHGVYRITRLPHHRFEDVIVACLWAGDRALASHETALVVYGLSDAMPSAVHITTPEPFRGKRSGVVIHHAALAEAERDLREDVPLTSVARTLSDVADRSPALARQALEEALARDEVSLRHLRRVAGDHPALERLLPDASP